MARKKVRKGASKSVARNAKANAVRTSAKGKSFGLAIVALILNVLFIPGLGTLVAGKSKTGAWQLVLLVIGIIFVSVAYVFETTVFYLGVPIAIAAWIWGLVTGISLLQGAE